MADYMGRGGKVSVGEDSSTWGTAGTPDRCFYTFSTDISTMMNVEFREALNEGLTGSVVSSFVNNGIDVGGTFEVEPAYEGFGLILYHALWGTTATSGTNPYTHTYTLAATPPALGLTVEQVNGNNTAEKFAGCRVSTLELTVSARGRMRARVTVIGKSGGGRTSATSTSVTTNHTPIQGYHAGSIGWNSLTWRTVDLALKVDNRFERQPLLGTQYTGEPFIAGPRVVTVTATVIYDADTAYSGFTAGTQSDFTVTFTSGSASMAWTLHNAVITECSAPVNKHGRIMQTLTLRGVSDGTDNGIAVVVINTQSSRVAA